MANRVMGYVICGYNSVDNLMSEQSSPFRRWTTAGGAGSSYRHHDHRNMYNKQMSEGTAAVATGGNVSRWSLGLEHLLADPAGAAAFAHFLSKEFAAENIRFWWSCEQYKSIEDSAKRAEMATEIWSRHLAEKASEPVNVDAAARRATALRLYHEPPPQDLFLQAQKQIFNVMKFDSYPRFLRSGVHAECARADLCGRPTPFCEDVPTKASPLKKSASNASERRRSGGASLLPWKLRAPSRDRNPPSPPPATDVVKCGQWSGQWSLCRVVLPDGATSVVGVDSQPVRGLVDRLLARRNLGCHAYDVLLKDARQGEPTNIDLSAASTTIGGREVVVERRVVVRVEVCGRCVCVRCRPTRRLRHVLRPVVARYGPALTPTVLRDGRPVHPDTLMQDLDGARLQVVDSAATECGEERDDDQDSLSDLALRLNEDATDGQSTNSAPASSRSALSNGGSSSHPTGVPSSGPHGVWGGPAVGPPGPPGPPTGAAGAGSRVKAALRPGPPLHHHPPDFLENLRETQRSWQQTKEPRSPPPLPPKPAQRSAPTLV